MERGGEVDCLRLRKKPRLENNLTRDNKNAEDLISHLPDECIFEIFSFLPSLRDRFSCATVSKKWLVLQANMRATAFKTAISTMQKQGNKTSRCLEGKKANDTRLAAIAVGICPPGGLRELYIRGSFPSQGITDFGLEIIAQACPYLKSLVLWDCLQIRNNGLISLSQRCSSIEKLDILNCPLVGDEGIIVVARKCRNLSSLSIESCPNIGNPSLQAVAAYSTNLKSISLIKCRLVSDEGILSVFSSLPDLERVKLVSISIGDCVLEAVGRHESSFASLCLENISGVSETGFCSIGIPEKLETLSLKSCSGLNDKCLKAIGSRFVRLKQIAIANCAAITDKGLQEMSRSTMLLESFKLRECHNVSPNGLMEVLMNCKERLKVLSLVKCHGLHEMDPSIFETPLPRCPLLQSITLNRCSGVGDSFLSWLGSSCVHVKNLELAGLSSITDKGLSIFLQALRNQSKGLVEVDLSRCFQLTDVSLLALTSGFGRKLKRLRLEGCERLSDKCLSMISEFCPSLLDLDLSGCGISDGGVYSLVKSVHQKIEVLSLAGCLDITDRSLSFLEIMCGNLVGLNLKHCPRLSKQGISSLRQTLWWCDLVY
ncbi:EIN3-binding F-box protein 2-like [Aristolochia californica]|uniref:EIN3-binding F-box protein 2-like n=1 Tax=Aristolochia californica TaxID=171875 RepID=UPI0035D55967